MLKAVVFFVFSFASVGYTQDFPQERDRITSPFAIELFDARQDGSLGAAPSSADVRSVTPLGLAMIIHFEGSVKKGDLHIPYDDSAGFCTIGYGRLLGKARCQTMNIGDIRNGISEDQAVKMLQEDMAFARRAVHRAMVYNPDVPQQQRKRIDINLDQFSALVSFVFNVGEGNFNKSTMLRRIRQDENNLAAREFLRWVRAGGQVFTGLIARRECEQTLFRGALSFGSNGQFSRNGCSSLGIAGTSSGPIDIDAGEGVAAE